jgi:hypothetical protein
LAYERAYVKATVSINRRAELSCGTVVPIRTARRIAWSARVGTGKLSIKARAVSIVSTLSGCLAVVGVAASIASWDATTSTCYFTSIATLPRDDVGYEAWIQDVGARRQDRRSEEEEGQY